MIAGDIDISRGYRKLFFAFGIEPDEENQQLRDAFSSLSDPKTIVTSNV